MTMLMYVDMTDRERDHPKTNGSTLTDTEPLNMHIVMTKKFNLFGYIRV